MEKRFSTNLKTILAVFWIAQYVFVNLASVLYLGVSHLEAKGRDDAKGITLSRKLFKTSPLFNIGSFVLCIVIAFFVLFVLVRSSMGILKNPRKGWGKGPYFFCRNQRGLNKTLGVTVKFRGRQRTKSKRGM